MPFYNYALTAKGSSRVIADTYAVLGRPATIKLLDDMKSLGLQAQHAGRPSASASPTSARPTARPTILDDGQKKADKIEKTYRMGAITDQERYAQLLDIWGHARKQVTDDLMAGLQNDYRDAEGKPDAAKDRRRQADPATSTPSP